jgi:hypothetical protein
VGPVRIVMPDIVGNDCFEVTAAEDEHPVEALAPDSAHDPLAGGVRSGCRTGLLIILVPSAAKFYIADRTASLRRQTAAIYPEAPYAYGSRWA